MQASLLSTGQEALPSGGPNPSTLYAIRQVRPDDHGFLVRHPESGELASTRSFPNGYCERPLTVPWDAAMALLEQFRKLVPGNEVWELAEAPHACPNCRREIWANDLDFLYSHKEGTLWRAGCNEHDFGCGFELVQEGTREEALRAWNTIPRD